MVALESFFLSSSSKSCHMQRTVVKVHVSVASYS